MADIYKLDNQIKHYEWGSPDILPRFLGLENRDGFPWAEMWMGTHEGAPSQAEIGENGKIRIDLKELAGGELPFLFKLLAVEKPLSIQAHPNRSQAAEGFRRENEEGIPLESYTRNYKDPNHKPEILCALSPFTVMAGFRQPAEIKQALEAFFPAVQPLLRALDAGSLADFFRSLFELSKQQREKLAGFILEKETCGIGETAISAQQWKLMKNFASQYPEDAAVISPLYLNLFTLEPGQAVFVPAGVLHAYAGGFGVELMTSSDNVLRGGLTPKHIDIPELMSILDFNPFMPPVFTPDSPSWFRYPAPCEDFSLVFMSGGEKIFPENGPAICIVTAGELRTGGTTVKKGESFFIPVNEKRQSPLVFGGDYSLFAALPAS